MQKFSACFRFSALFSAIIFSQIRIQDPDRGHVFFIEVVQQSQSFLSYSDIVADLRFVLVCELRHRLDFQNDFIKTDEIGEVVVVESLAAIIHIVSFLSFERNTLVAEFYGKCLLIDTLLKPDSQPFVDFVHGIVDGR